MAAESGCARSVHLVVIETGDIQHYLFASNKVRENVGASELVYRLGTQFVLEAVAELGGRNLWSEAAGREDGVRDRLVDPAANPRIEDGSTPAEIVIANSGRAVVLARDREVATGIVQRVTRRALLEAPGLLVHGAVHGFDWHQQPVCEAERDVRRKLDRVRVTLPGPEFRFLRLPIVAECGTSGLPASEIEPEEEIALSAVSKAKRLKRPFFHERVAHLLGDGGGRFTRDIDELERGLDLCNWIAVVHADGNGFGQMFIDLAKKLGATDASENRRYIDTLRTFSLALNRCAENAFRHAIGHLVPQDKDLVPLVPLVVGGDDLTVICPGGGALDFAAAYLRQFERETSSDSLVSEIAERVFSERRLASCAGVAIMKPHYPFFQAYPIAEQLVKSAKQVKQIATRNGRPRPCSALDFQVLHGSEGTDLDLIRQKMTADDGLTRLWARPYVVTPIAAQDLEGEEEHDAAWLKSRGWDEFKDRVAATHKESDGRRALPRSQLHDLREGLFQGRDVADYRLRLMWGRYKDSGLDRLVADAEKPSLFWRERDRDAEQKERHVTALLDVLDAEEFLTRGHQP